MRYLAPLLSLAAAIVPACARSSTGDRVLVVLDKLEKAQYSSFFDSLEGRGYVLTFAKPDDNDALLSAFGVEMYDHLIYFAPENKGFGKHLAPQLILDEQAKGLNTLFVLSPGQDEAQRALFAQYDLELAPRGMGLVDAFAHVGGAEISDVVLGKESLVAAEPILQNKRGPVVFPRGTGFITGENPFLLDIVRAPETSFIALGDKPVDTKVGAEVKFAGRDVTLVAAMQNRENVRIGFAASPELFGNTWWGGKLDGKETGNRAFIEDFTKWLFQETGVIRVVRTEHHRSDETEPRELYRKKANVTYAITLQEHETVSGESAWKAFHTDDLQLEFTMLDPHYRLALPEVSSTKSDTTYSTSFTAPDRHGVFKFVVQYWRPGWSYLNTADKASVAPLRHDQHPRWIPGAYPFYAGALSTSAAFLLFTALWMHLGEGDRGKKKAE